MKMLLFYIGLLGWMCVCCVQGEDPYRNFNWVVTYGQISPLGLPQRVNSLLYNLFSVRVNYKNRLCKPCPLSSIITENILDVCKPLQVMSFSINLVNFCG
ncbi:hypothetical protein Hanom_Chr06g00551581 [Helianthus anomalus]